MRRVAVTLVLLSTFVFDSRVAHASLNNGDFETGDFTGWTTFTTEIGFISGNQPAGVFLFDVDGDGDLSQSARFQVGSLGIVHSGGGIFQTVTSRLPFSIEADIAASSSTNNGSAGLFELIVNDVVIDSHDFGRIDRGEIKRSALYSGIIPAGSHEVRFRMTRRFKASPLQYIDNVELLQVPEPTTSALAHLAVLCFGALFRLL